MGKVPVETRKLEDEKGMHLLELKFTNPDGSVGEFTYLRKGPMSNVTTIMIVHYRSEKHYTDGDPLTCDQLAKCIDGEWKF